MTGKVGFMLGLLAGSSLWLIAVGATVFGSTSIDTIVAARGYAGSVALVLVVAATAVYWRERSFSRTNLIGFFFGFTIGFGVLAIPTSPAF